MLIPDYYFEHFYELTPEFLHTIGVSAIVCDIDNTLVTYDDPIPTEPVSRWVELMRASGVRILFLSNNHPPRVQRFAESLGLPFYADAHKPSTKILLFALRKEKIDPKCAISLGDQLFTDILAGHRGGLSAVLVPPIKDRTDFFHRLKRLGERPFMSRYFRSADRGTGLWERWLVLTGNRKSGKNNSTER